MGQGQVHGLHARRLKTSRQEIDEDLYADDSKSVYFGWQRPLILLSKSLRQQSKRQVRNYQSYDEVFLVV